MCKALKVPVDDKIFERTNEAQYMWYQTQVALDEEDKFEMLREVAEHNAMFWNAEGVEKVRDARKNTYETPEDRFDDMVEEMFGRPISNDQESKDSTKLDPYLDMDLDEIKFTPV